MFTGWWGPLSSNIKIHDAHSSVKWNAVKFTSFFFFLCFSFILASHRPKFLQMCEPYYHFPKVQLAKSPFQVVVHSLLFYCTERKRILLFCTVLINFHYLSLKKVLCFSVSMNCLIMISIWFLSNQGQGIWF